MPIASVNGIDVWYSIEGSGPTLLLTHGFAGPTGGWPAIVEELPKRYRLVLYDVRGHGKTTVPDASTFSLPQFASDLAGLMDALDIERAHIAGVSMGGMISAQFACDFPDRLQSLLLFDTTAGNRGDAGTAPLEQQLVDVFVRLEAIVRKYGLEGLVARENRYRHDGDPYAAKSFFTLDEQDQRNRESKARMTAAGFIAANIALRERPDLSSRLSSISVPTLVSCGEWDMFYPLAHRDAKLIPNARFSTVRYAAHDTTNYRPRSWLRALTEFIDDVEAGRDVRGAVEYTD